MLISGSYDQSVCIWDIRNIKKPIESLNLEASVWDIKFSQDRRVSIASIYDGYRFSKTKIVQETDGKLFPDINDWEVFTEHSSICYAAEWTGLQTTQGLDLVVSSSFYDSTLKLI